MLYIDCGHTLRGRHYTGIQRYVRRTLRHAHALLGPQRVRALAAGEHGWEMLQRADAHPLEQLPDLLLQGGTPSFDASSRVVLADRFWHTGAWDALDALLASPARITLVVFDLLSLRQPQWFPPGVGARFDRYLRAVLPRADDLVCLSQLVASEVGEWARREGLSAPAARVVRPGHEAWSGEPRAPAWLPPRWLDEPLPLVLQVGTLEPRKNQRLTLEAMRMLWARGAGLRCLFVGQDGWHMDGFAQTLAALPQWGTHLHWATECTDAELDWCYRHASVLCFPSSNEGYGLPLAEAASLGTRVLAADTAIHRELARALGTLSLELCPLAPDLMAQRLANACAQPRVAAAHPRRSWAEATSQLLAPLLR